MHSNLFHGMLNAVKVVSQMWARDTWNSLETDGHFYRSRYVKFPWPWIYVFFNRFPVARLLQALRLEYPFCPIRGFERNRNSVPKYVFVNPRQRSNCLIVTSLHRGVFIVFLSNLVIIFFQNQLNLETWSGETTSQIMLSPGERLSEYLAHPLSTYSKYWLLKCKWLDHNIILHRSTVVA